MSNKNYSKFFKVENKEEQLENVQQMTIQTDLNEEVVNEEVVNEEVVNEEVVNEEVNETVTETIGIVTGCKKLNVRKAPSKEADVVCIIDEGAEVVIDSKSSTTEEFYKVTTSNGVEGYCMKKFITIK